MKNQGCNSVKDIKCLTKIKNDFFSYLTIIKIFFCHILQNNFVLLEMRCDQWTCWDCRLIQSVSSYVLSAAIRMMERLPQCCLDADGTVQAFLLIQHILHKMYNTFIIVKAVNETPNKALCRKSRIFNLIDGLRPIFIVQK